MAKIEDCQKHLNALKEMVEELVAKKKSLKLLASLRQAEKKFTASVNDWERMVRDHLE